METQTGRATSRPPLMFLSSCRRLQILVFTFIFTVYILCIIYVLVSTYMVSESKQTSDNKKDKRFLYENTKNIDVEDEYNINVSYDSKGELYEENSILFNSSFIQVIKCCKGNVCINKCCPLGRAFEGIQNKICVFDKPLNTFNQEMFVDKTLQILNKNISEINYLRNRFIYTDKCGSNLIKEFDVSEIRLVADGVITIKGTIYRLYCLDFVVSSETILADVCEEGDEYEDVEYTENKDEVLSAEFVTFIACIFIFFMVVSKLSIIVILIVYSCIPQLRNLHGKIIICLMVSVMISHLTLVGNMMHSIAFSKSHMGIDFISDMAIISWMSWLTVLCYDIWNTFSQPLHNNPQLRHNNRKFGLYFAICCVNIIVHAILERLITLKDNKVLITPYYCKFAVALNVFMFLSTLLNFRFHSVNTAENSRHGDSAKEGIQLYTKLSLLMGLDWLLTIGCITFGGLYGVLFSFLIIESQGVTLLVLLVCNKRVLRLIREKCNARELV